TLAWFPAVILIVVLGVDELADQLAPRRPAVKRALYFGVATLAVCCLIRAPRDGAENLKSRIISSVDAFEASSDIGRAVFLFRFSPEATFRVDPVYTLGAAWPDDARWIHARDLGFDRDRELVAYYTQRQPDRRVITIDLGS